MIPLTSSFPRFFILALLYYISIFHSFAQIPALYSSSGFEYGKANIIDAQGNYINTALFQNTISITDSVSLSAQGIGTDIAVTKYDSNGKLIWAKRMGGVSADGPHGVGTDDMGNIYLTGYFGSTQAAATSNFDPEGSLDGNVIAQGGEDAFLAKYDVDGNFLWAFGLGNTGETTQERAWDIVVDSKGNSYVGGGFWGSMDFNPLGNPNVKSLSSGNGGLFLAKYDPDGMNEWALVIDANITNVFAEGYITFDLNTTEDEIFIGGNFRGANVETNPLGNNSNLISSNGLADMFVANFDVANGHLNWVESIGSPQQDLIAPGALRLDNVDNVWFTGRLSGNNNVDFDPTSGVSTVSNSSLFLASFTSSGEFRTALGMDSGAGDGGHRVGFDKENNVYLAGWMSGRLNFGNGIIKTAYSTTADVFLAKYTQEGICQWANHFGGEDSEGNSICAGLVVDQAGNSYLTGQLYGINAPIDPSNSERLMSSVGSNDCFVIRYDSNGNLFDSSISTSISAFDNEAFSIYPNPTQSTLYIKLDISPQRNMQIRIINHLGQIQQVQEVLEKTTQVNIRHLSSGNYILILVEGEKNIGKASFVKY